MTQSSAQLVTHLPVMPTVTGKGKSESKGLYPVRSSTASGRSVGGFLFAALFAANAAAWSTASAQDATAQASAAEVSDQTELFPEATARQLVEEMAQAMESLTYRGAFVHMMGSSVESMRILHTRRAEGEFERLTSLNGEAREVFRTDKLVTCVWPGSMSVIVGASKERKSIPRINATVLASDYYSISHEGFDRVAGRDVYLIDIMPADTFRYGYRFWIDQEQKMLLRMLLLDEKSTIIEQVMFTSIDYPKDIALEHFQAKVDPENYTVTNTVDTERPESIITVSGQTKTGSGTALSTHTVVFNSLPGGYFKVSETYNPMPIGDTPVSHVTISDGMASVSVYVEYMPADQHEKGASGLSRMGAVNAYGASLPEAFVTVVGEVPASVVKAIGDAITLKGG